MEKIQNEPTTLQPHFFRWSNDLINKQLTVVGIKIFGTYNQPTTTYNFLNQHRAYNLQCIEIQRINTRL